MPGALYITTGLVVIGRVISAMIGVLWLVMTESFCCDGEFSWPLGAHGSVHIMT